MKQVLIAAAVLAMMVGCEQFSTSYQRIDDDEFRMLNFMYEPADAAPGDSVTLTAVFAGKGRDANLTSINWQISFNAIVNDYGSTTLIDSTPLAKVSTPATITSNENTQTVAFKFKIPDDIVKTSKSIPDNWTDMIPAYMRNRIPQELRSLTKSQLVDLIDNYAENSTSLSSEVKKYLPAVCQFLTVPFFVTARVDGWHSIRSYQSVRYNSRFENISDMARPPINRKPEIDSIVVYKVKGDVAWRFDDKSGKDYKTIRLDNSADPAIPVESGYSYYLELFSSPIDLTMTMDDIMSGSTVPATKERHDVYWQFQLDKNETAGIDHTEFMDINNGSGKLTPPEDRRIKNFTLWVTVKDDVTNERLRPIGWNLHEIKVRFDYK